MGTLLVRGLFAIALPLTLVFPAWAQEAKGIGVVTALTGRADLKRPQAPETPLKLRDNLFVRDVVDTQKESVARFLLMGKSTVTVRELSRFEIREEVRPDGSQRALINLAEGRIRVMVARRLMRPGDEVEIRTPNAVAAVRGSDGIIEVSKLPDGRPQTVITGVSGEFQLTLPTTPPFITKGKEFQDGSALAGAAASVLFAMAETASDGGSSLLQLAQLPTALNVTALLQAQITGFAGAQALAQALLTQTQLNQLTGIYQLNVGATGANQPPPATTDRAANQGLSAATTATLVTGAQPGLSAIAGQIGTGVGGIVQPSVLTPLTASQQGGGGTCIPGSGEGSCPTLSSTSSSTPSSPPPPPSTNLISNGGFETGDLQNWTLDGAGKVISQFGSATINPAAGSFMFLGHTGTGAVNLSPCASAADACQRSTLSQTFNVNSVLNISFKYVLFTKEGNCTASSCAFQTDTGASARNDKWQVRLIPSSGSPVTLFQTTVQDELAAGNFTRFGQSFGIDTNGDGINDFTLQPNSARTVGDASDFTAVSKTVVVSSGSATLEFSITDIGDTLFDSGALLDVVVATQDPPLYFLRDGATLVRTDPSPLLQFTNAPQTFDSALVVCCNSSVSLAGPLLRATDSDLNVAFSLVSLLQGGTLSTSSGDPLVLLEGGTHSLGAAVGVFDVAGVTTAYDPTTGLYLGSDRPLQHGGVLLETSGATVTTERLLKLDTASLEASAPLLDLTAGSQMTSASDLVKLAEKAQLAASVPYNALVKLNASALTVANGSLFNVARGSVLNVTGNLVLLANGSTLSILNGSLVSISGGSVFKLAGGSLGAFGAGTNALNIANAAPLCTGCSITTGIPNLGGYPVLLKNGALASNVTVAPGFTPFAGLNQSNTVKVSGPSAAVLTVSGVTSKVTLGP